MTRRVNSRQRRGPFREPHTRLLVVCGARSTEPTYLTGLRQAARNPAVAVHVLRHPRDPESVVRYATKRRDLLRDDVDQVWCVLDVDDFDYARTISVAEREEIRLAISNPCFEVWLLQHHIDLGAEFHSPGAVLDRLEQVVPGYRKTALNFSDFAEHVPEAIRRAKTLSPEATPLGGNPSSGMWRLAELIRSPGAAARA